MNRIQEEDADDFDEIAERYIEDEEGEEPDDEDSYVLDELLGRLKAEEASAVGEDFENQVLQEQADALRAYYGDSYGDEAPGRSQVVTREVFETIEWIRPDLLRIFAGNGETMATVEPSGPADFKFAQAAERYLNYVFFEDNDGYKFIDAFAFDGLAQKLGVGAVYWEPNEYYGPETLTGLNAVQVQQLQADNTLEMEEPEAKPRPEGQSEAYPDGMEYEVEVRRLSSYGCAKVINVPPEYFRVGTGVTDLDDCRYCARIVPTTKSELKKAFPEHADDIDDWSAGDMTLMDDERRHARFDDQEDFDEHPGEEDILLTEEYIRYDLNGDGLSEMVAVKRLGDLLLEVEEVDDHPFFDWTPIRVPHRLHGLSIYDIMKDVQRTKTVLMRAALDATYQAVAPRVAANVQNVNMGDLLSVKAGGVIRVRGEPRANMQPMAVPDLAPSALRMMEFVDQVGEARSGVTRNAQGLDPDSLNKTATGIKLMQNAASARKEMIARNMAAGLKKGMRKLLRLIAGNQDFQRQIAVAGEIFTVDPRSWNADMRVVVHPGAGLGDTEVQIQYLTMLMQLQEKWMGNFGPQNGMVNHMHIHATAEKLIHAMGFRSSLPFVGSPDQFQPPQQQGDPKAEAEKAKIQLEAQRMQMEQQFKAQEAELRAQEQQAKMALMDQQAQAEVQREIQRQQAEIDLAREKYEREMALKERQLAGELELKERQLAAELRLKEQYQKSQAEMGGTSPVRPGGNPG